MLIQHTIRIYPGWVDTMEQALRKAGYTPIVSGDAITINTFTDDDFPIKAKNMLLGGLVKQYEMRPVE